MTPLPSHLILDFDGTLIDSGPAVLEAFAASLRAHGIAPVRPLTRDLIGPPLHTTLQTLTGISDKNRLEVLAAEFRMRYDTEGLYATVFYAGIPEALQAQLDAGRQLHLATNKREKPTLLLLEHFGWKPWFTSVYCVDSRSPPFPSKGEMLRVQLQEQHLNATDCLYVGDTHHDEVAAADAGIPFVAAGWGYGTGTQAVTATARVLASPADLVF
jgi:phosphoglycolate phosphatase